MTAIDRAELRRALDIVAGCRAYTKQHFTRDREGYVGHTPAADYEAAVDTLVTGLTEILDAPAAAPPHEDARTAVVNAVLAHLGLTANQSKLSEELYAWHPGDRPAGRYKHTPLTVGEIADIVAPVIERRTADARQLGRAALAEEATR